MPNDTQPKTADDLEDSASKQIREAQHLREAHNHLQLLQLVAGNDHLIAGNEIYRVRRLAFVYGREIYRDRFQRSIRLLAEHHDTAAIAGLQDAARFRDCFGYRQATRHQLDSRSPDVADHAVAIRTRLIERDRHLRIDNVFVVALLDHLGDLIGSLAVNKQTFGDQREVNATAGWNLNALPRILFLLKYVDRDNVLRAQTIIREEVVVVRNDRGLFGRFIDAIRLRVGSHVRILWLVFVFFVFVLIFFILLVFIVLFIFIVLVVLLLLLLQEGLNLLIGILILISKSLILL